MDTKQETLDSAGFARKYLRLAVSKEASLIAVIVGLIIIVSIVNPRFATAENVYNIIRQISILLIVALGGTFVILTGGIDFSVGAVINLAGIIAGLFVFLLGPWAISIGLLVGLGCGLMNGLAMTRLRIPSFIGTLGMLSVYQGLALIISQGKYRLFNEPSFIAATQGSFIGNIPNIGLWAFAVQAVCVFVAYRTIFGRYIYAIGGGEGVARASGVAVDRIKLYAFMFCGAAAGLSGALLASRLASTTANMGDGLLIDSIASIVLGGTAITGGVGGPWKTLLGAILMGVLSSAMNIMGITPFIQTTLKGLIIVIAVAITFDRTKVLVVK
jgi:ribose/xylose/arabinose/galactoside ABC-type transport system permease subunit